MMHQGAGTCIVLKMEEAGGVTIKRRHLAGRGVLENGLGEAALLVAFLAKVSTKLDLIDLATFDRVA
jgi:hypothetical protein